MAFVFFLLGCVYSCSHLLWTFDRWVPLLDFIQGFTIWTFAHVYMCWTAHTDYSLDTILVWILVLKTMSVGYDLGNANLILVPARGHTKEICSSYTWILVLWFIPFKKNLHSPYWHFNIWTFSRGRFEPVFCSYLILK